jgi:rRNA maturation endonuclease Nob1
MDEGYVTGEKRTWYDVCVKCKRIVSPRHTACPKCGGTEFKGTIRTKQGNEIRRQGF